MSVLQIKVTGSCTCGYINEICFPSKLVASEKQKPEEELLLEEVLLQAQKKENEYRAMFCECCMDGLGGVSASIEVV